MLRQYFLPRSRHSTHIVRFSNFFQALAAVDFDLLGVLSLPLQLHFNSDIFIFTFKSLTYPSSPHFQYTHLSIKAFTHELYFGYELILIDSFYTKKSSA